MKKERSSTWSSRAKRHWKLVLFSIALVWIAPSILIYRFWGGEGGDAFGASNALFSGLALGAVAFTLIMQNEDLKLQQEELRLTRNEIEGQREALDLQVFQQRFFNLIDSAVASLHQTQIHLRRDLLLSGRAAINEILNRYEKADKGTPNSRAIVSSVHGYLSPLAAAFGEVNRLSSHVLREEYQMILIDLLSEQDDLVIRHYIEEKIGSGNSRRNLELILEKKQSMR